MGCCIMSALRRPSQVKLQGGRPRTASDVSSRNSNWFKRIFGDISSLLLYVFTGCKTIERTLRTSLPRQSSDIPSAYQAILEARVRSALVESVTDGIFDDKRISRLLTIATDPKEIALAVVEAEAIRPEKAGFQTILQRLVVTCEAFCAVNAALTTATDLYQVAFDNEDPDHIALLLQLWRTVKPESLPVPGTGSLTDGSYKAEAWSTLGFQGHDPGTDFRGMGMLGLYQLLHYMRVHNDAARSCLAKLNLPTVGYPLAIVSIAISDWAVSLLRERKIDGHMSPCSLWMADTWRGVSAAGSGGGGKGGRAGATETTSLLAAAAGETAEDTVASSHGSQSHSSPEDLITHALPTLNAIHSCLLLVFDAVWWAQGDVARYVPTPAAAQRMELIHAGADWLSVLDGSRAASVGASSSTSAMGTGGRHQADPAAPLPAGCKRRGVVYALAQAVRVRAIGNSTLPSSYQAGSTGVAGKGPLPLTVMDFPRVFKEYKQAVEELLAAER